MTGIPPGVLGVREVRDSKAVARLGRAAAVLLTLACSGCMVGPDYQSPPAPAAVKFLEANQPSVDTKTQEYETWWRVFHDPVLDRLIEIAYDQNLQPGRRRDAGVAGARRTWRGDRRFLSAVAAGDELDYLRPAEPRRSDRDPAKPGFRLLARLARRVDRLGTGFLGQVPPRDPVGRRRLSRLDRFLRRYPGDVAWRRRHDLYRHPHLADADRDRRGQYRQAEKGARHRRGAVSRRRRDQTRRLSGGKRARARPNRRCRS